MNIAALKRKFKHSLISSVVETLLNVFVNPLKAYGVRNIQSLLYNKLYVYISSITKYIFITEITP